MIFIHRGVRGSDYSQAHQFGKGQQLLHQGRMLTGQLLSNPLSLWQVRHDTDHSAVEQGESLLIQAGVWLEAVLHGPAAFGLHFMLDIDLNSSVSHPAGLMWLKG